MLQQWAWIKVCLFCPKLNFFFLVGLRNYFQWFIESNVLRTRRWHIHMFCKDKIAELIIAASKKKTTSTNGHFSTIGHFSTAAAFFCPYKTHLKNVNCCLKGAQTQCHRALGFYINWLACHFMPTHRTLICFPKVAFQPWLLLIIQCSI